MDKYLLVQYIGEGLTSIIDMDTWANIKAKLDELSSKKVYNSKRELIEYSMELATNIDEADEITVTYRDDGNDKIIRSKTFFNDDIAIIKEDILMGKLDELVGPNQVWLRVYIEYPDDYEPIKPFGISRHPVDIKGNKVYSKAKVSELCSKAYEEAFHIAQSTSPIKDISKWLRENLQ